MSRDLEKELDEVGANQEGLQEEVYQAGTDEQGFVHVTRLIEKTRKEEKAKLYPLIEERNRKIADLEQQILEKTESLQKKDAEGLVIKTQVEAKLSELENNLLNMKTQAEEETRKSRLEAMKEKKLRELEVAGTGYIPDLIGGNSEEELNASIELSSQRYQEIFNQAVQKVSSKTSPSRPTTNEGTGTVPAVGGVIPEAQNILQNVKNIDQKDWPKIREQVLKEVGKLTRGQ